MTLYLPGQRPPRGGLTIHIPAGADVRPKTGECFLCGAEFREGDDVVRHMKTCIPAAGHEVQSAEYEKRDRMEIFQEDAWDPEVAAHLRNVGKQMLREGRLEMKPNERAGFS